MRLWLLTVICTTMCITSLALNDEDRNEKSNNINEIKTFQKKMLARRREEHLALLKGIAQNEKYEWRYQLVQIGVTKVLI